MLHEQRKKKEREKRKFACSGSEFIAYRLHFLLLVLRCTDWPTRCKPTYIHIDMYMIHIDTQMKVIQLLLLFAFHFHCLFPFALFGVVLCAYNNNILKWYSSELILLYCFIVSCWRECYRRYCFYACSFVFQILFECAVRYKGK